MMNEPVLSDILAAHKRIKHFIHKTPVLSSSSINELYGANLYFKCENLQKTGAFKARGAFNAVYSLADNTARKGVTTHSSGNHAAALAYAATTRGIPVTVVMPSNAPAIKKAAVAAYGANIIYCEPTLQAREAGVARVVAETGASLIPPYNDCRVMAGQATAAVELLEDVEDLDSVITPIGGGGLISGTALAAHYINPKINIIGAEPQDANDASRSLLAGRLIPLERADTIADGLRTSLGDLTFPVIKKYVNEIVCVSEPQIIAAMRDIWERMKIIIEPSSAVALAAVKAKPELFRNKKVGIILTGGNVDLQTLPWQSK